MNKKKHKRASNRQCNSGQGKRSKGSARNKARRTQGTKGRKTGQDGAETPPRVSDSADSVRHWEMYQASVSLMREVMHVIGADRLEEMQIRSIYAMPFVDDGLPGMIIEYGEIINRNGVARSPAIAIHQKGFDIYCVGFLSVNCHGEILTLHHAVDMKGLDGLPSEMALGMFLASLAEANPDAKPIQVIRIR